MRSSEIVRAMDTEEGAEVSVNISNPLGQVRVVIADTTQIPYHRIYLTALEARRLAEYLTEQADAADEANDA